MYRVGNEELKRIRSVVETGRLFRYGIGDECATFERRYAEKLGVKHCVLTASGTNALTAALIGARIGPGDEVIIPACTYMATAIAVVAAGAIPLIVDIDDSITLDPVAAEKAIGPRTKAVIPVHMWGQVCDMNAFQALSDRFGVLIIEDACQAVGGAYEGRMVGSIGAVGGFSFNYYKNMTCGEGGAVVTDDESIAERMRCVVDPCSFYWNGRDESFAGFTYDGARASEIEGAMLNAQLDRIDGMIEEMRRQKRKILDAAVGAGLTPVRANSIEWECGTHVMFRFPSAAQAEAFAELAGGTVAIKTGRHVYTEWDQILGHRGAHHPALNPFELQANRECRMNYSKEMCRRSLDILGTTVFIQTHPDRTENEVEKQIETVCHAASEMGNRS